MLQADIVGDWTSNIAADMLFCGQPYRCFNFPCVIGLFIRLWTGQACCFKETIICSLASRVPTHHNWLQPAFYTQPDDLRPVWNRPRGTPARLKETFVIWAPECLVNAFHYSEWGMLGMKMQYRHEIKKSSFRWIKGCCRRNSNLRSKDGPVDWLWPFVLSKSLS